MEKSGIYKLQVKEVWHISTAVNDAKKVTEAWSSMFGIGPWKFIDIGGIDAKGRPWKAMEAHASLGSLGIELIQPVEGRIVQSRFLDTRGPGLHHIAFLVEDPNREADNLVAQGAKLLIKDPGNFSYLESGAPDGAVFEVASFSQVAKW